jgi:hypothetical protein
MIRKEEEQITMVRIVYFIISFIYCLTFFCGVLDALESEDLRAILNERGGILYARVGSHPPWPARVC